MNRRKFAGLLAAGGIGIYAWLNFEKEGEPYSDYFRKLNTSLRGANIGIPVLVLDLDRLNRNIERLRSILNPECNYRVVVKSLPSIDLIDHVMKRMNTNRLMVFHQPFINLISKEFPDSDLLVGKPMPVAAAEMFYQQKEGGQFNPEEQLQWLVDTPQRLVEYLNLAKNLNQKLLVNFELDVGLHRGGVDSENILAEMLQIVQKNRQHLTFSGFMGYDPHVGKIPTESALKTFEKSQEIYADFKRFVAKQFPSLWSDNLCFNGAGSPSMLYHKEETECNDLAAGSCLVKPSDFDIDSLSEFEPASYIATPILKISEGTNLPGVELLNGPINWLFKNREKTFFIYGGYWKANYESPSGLKSNGLFGRSTNQDFVNGSDKLGLKVDDNIFLRPTQSERVLLQFSQMIVASGGTIQEVWKPLNYVK